MDIHQFSKLFWGNRDHTAELARMIQRALKGVEAPGMSTSDLMHKLGAKNADMKGLTPQLSWVRKDYPEFVTAGKPNGVTFGRPTYRWHDAPGVTIAGTTPIEGRRVSVPSDYNAPLTADEAAKTAILRAEMEAKAAAHEAACPGHEFVDGICTHCYALEDDQF